MEIWEEVKEYSSYAVSSWGRVMNVNTGRILSLTQNQHGTVFVGFTVNGLQSKRSVALLVANAFLAYPYHELFTTPIHLNGDRTDNGAENLDWRPLWFAQTYHSQFSREYRHRLHFPIEVVETGEVYSNSIECAKALGVLEKDLVMAVLNEGQGRVVFPTDYTFRSY